MSNRAKKINPPEWTDGEKEFLRRNYRSMSNRDIGKALGRPRGGVSRMIKVLGLTSKRTKPYAGSRKYTNLARAGVPLWEALEDDDQRQMAVGFMNYMGKVRTIAHRENEWPNIGAVIDGYKDFVIGEGTGWAQDA